MSNCVLLKSYGRAGSHLIIDWFLNLGYNYFDTEIHPNAHINKRVKKLKNNIIKDHGLTYVPKVNITLGILLLRKNILLQSLSELIARRTKRWVAPYDNKKFKPFFLNENDVFNEILYIKKTNQKREKMFKKLKLNYKIVFYEDFANNPKFLNLILGIENNLESWSRPISPYKAQELVINYEELRLKYCNSLL